jgi:hypothetical protein
MEVVAFIYPMVRDYFTQVPDLIGVWILVCSLSAAKAVALTERAIRAATATMMDFFILCCSFLCSV